MAQRTSVAGSRILITGASSGVGMCAARIFGAEGARLVLMARRASVIADLADEIGNAIALPVDVTDSRSVAAGIARAHAELGAIDIAVNAAGTGMPTPLETLDPAGWRDVIATNLSGSFYVARETALRMVEDGGGAIVNIGSDLSLVGMSMYSAYCASKFAVIGLTKALAVELAPTVRVNVVCPGPIDTPMMEAELDWFPDPEATRRAALERVPLHRFSSPDEVVSAIRFLAVGAPFATGCVLPTDGGTTMV